MVSAMVLLSDADGDCGGGYRQTEEISHFIDSNEAKAQQLPRKKPSQVDRRDDLNLLV